MSSSPILDLYEISKHNMGLILMGRTNPMEYSPQDFPEPFSSAIRTMQSQQYRNLPPEQRNSAALQFFSPSMLQEMKDGVSNLDGLGDLSQIDYRVAQRKAMQISLMGKMLERYASMANKGVVFDPLPIYSELGNYLVDSDSGLRDASRVDWKSYKPFMKSGYAPFDSILGGMPTDGPIVVVGQQGVGKSAFGFNFMCKFLKTVDNSDLGKDYAHLTGERTGAIYTLEMSEAHYIHRSLNLYPEHEDIVKSGRLLISGNVKNIDQLVAEISSNRVKFVVLDDMDGIVEDESAAAYQRVYKRIREICRFLKIPFMVLAQPNRAAKMAERFLNISDSAWTGAAENAAALHVCLQKVNPSYMEWTDDRFPIESKDGGERQFIILWKSRDGWLGDREPGGQFGPGAIRLEPNPTTGRYSRMWEGEVYKGKLWTPGESSKSKRITSRS